MRSMRAAQCEISLRYKVIIQSNALASTAYEQLLGRTPIIGVVGVGATFATFRGIPAGQTDH